MIRNLKNRSYNKAFIALKGLSPVITSTFNGKQGLGFGGTGPLSAAYKLDFNTEIFAAQSSANLTAGACQCGAWGNLTMGIITQIGNSNASSTTNKHTFSTLTTALNSGTMVVGRTGGYGSGNATVAYFFGGGDSSQIPANVNSTDKFSYASLTFAAVSSGKLSTKSLMHSSVSSNVNAYVIGGGTVQYGSTPTARAEKLPYATETIATVSSLTLPTAKARGVSGQYLLEKGYYAAGNNGAMTNTVYKSTFTTEVVSTLGTCLYTLHDCYGMFSSVKLYGFCGYDSGFTNKVQAMTFSTETWAAGASVYPVSCTCPTSLN